MKEKTLGTKKSAIPYKEIALWIACSFTCFQLNSIYKIQRLLDMEEDD